MAFYSPPNVVGTNGQIQYNDNGVLEAAPGISYDKESATISVTLQGVSTNLNQLLKSLAESEAIRLRGTYSIGVAGTVPFGVGPITSTGMDLAPIGAEHYNVIDIKSGSFC
jgi:hypothetical protein